MYNVELISTANTGKTYRNIVLDFPPYVGLVIRINNDDFKITQPMFDPIDKSFHCICDKLNK